MVNRPINMDMAGQSASMFGGLTSSSRRGDEAVGDGADDEDEDEDGCMGASVTSGISNLRFKSPIPRTRIHKPTRMKPALLKALPGWNRNRLVFTGSHVFENRLGLLQLSHALASQTPVASKIRVKDMTTTMPVIDATVVKTAVCREMDE